MKKKYTYKKVKHNRKIILFPLVLLITIITIIAVLNLTKKETNAETENKWVCYHSDFKIDSIELKNGKHVIKVNCGICKETVISFENTCISSLNKCLICNCNHSSEKRKIVFDKNENNQDVIQIKCDTCNKVIAVGIVNETIITGTGSPLTAGHLWVEATCHCSEICVICEKLAYDRNEVANHYNTNNHFTSKKNERIEPWDETTHKVIEWCSACGEDVNTKTKNHTWPSSWTITSVYHTKECTDCGEIKEESHDWQAANCKNPPMCKTCGFTAPGQSANPNAHVDDDDNNICDLCEKEIESIVDPSTCKHPSVKTKATCSSNAICGECGGEIPNSKLAHTYSVATCTKAKTCTSCGITEGDALGHSYTRYSSYTYNSTNGGQRKHYKICDRCGANELVNCIKTTTAVETKPTCEQDGKWKYTCGDCGEDWYMSIAAIGHKFDSDGNCIRTGCTATQDSTCTHQNIISSKYTYTDDDTCTKTEVCSCGEVITTETSHTGGTHENGGICDNCNEQYQDHNRTDGIIKRWKTTETTHTPILNCYACDRTGGSGTILGSAMEHVGGTHANGGKCAVDGCGVIYQEHDEIVDYARVSATKHRKITECSCGKITETDDISNHTYYDVHTWNRDNGDGTHSVRCKDCLGYGKIEAHTYSAGTCTTKPTCTAEGCKAQLDITPSHIGGTHSNGGKCTECKTVYQTHSQSTNISSYVKTSTQHIPLYSCTYSGCNATERGTGVNHTISTYTNNEDGTHSGTCTTCQYSLSEAHIYSNGICTSCGANESDTPTVCSHTYIIKSDANSHWEQCTKCNEIKEGSKTNHSATTWTDDGNGNHSGTCAVCNYKLTNSHTYSNGICTSCGAKEVCSHTYEIRSDANRHWEQCIKCNNIKAGTVANHNVTTWTDDGNGKHIGICTVCNYKLANSHTYSNGTCTSCGAKESCSHTYEIRSDANRHWEQCTKCSNIKAETIASHNITTWTDKEDGNHSGTCTVCNKVIEEAHTNGMSGKCAKCNYDGTSNNSNNSGNNSNNNNENNNSGANGVDNTTTNGKLPQTGARPTIVFSAIGGIGLAGFTIFKMKKLKDIK